MIMNNTKVNANYYMFYAEPPMSAVLCERIASDCLGNAITVAKEVADRCNLSLIGVAHDLGIKEEINCSNPSESYDDYLLASESFNMLSPALPKQY